MEAVYYRSKYCNHGINTESNYCVTDINTLNSIVINNYATSICMNSNCCICSDFVDHTITQHFKTMSAESKYKYFKRTSDLHIIINNEYLMKFDRYSIDYFDLEDLDIFIYRIVPDYVIIEENKFLRSVNDGSLIYLSKEAITNLHKLEKKLLDNNYKLKKPNDIGIYYEGLNCCVVEKQTNIKCAIKKLSK